jgi:secreted PhoX family phosphatase
MDTHKPAMSRSQAFEESENVGRNASANPTMGDIIATRYNRRDLLRNSLAVAAITATVSPLALAAGRRAEAAAPEASFGFTEIEAGVDETHHVAPGYRADILIRWGDPVLPGAPAFDPNAQSAAAQKQQFGYNNDFVGFFPIEGSSEHGLLVVNHEYTDEEIMFPSLSGAQDTKEAGFAQMTQDLADVEMAAHGGTVLEIRKVDGRWQVVPDSKYNRRITTSDTAMELTGPAAGHALLQTKADATGKSVVGMVNNCAGGVTPWGTWLSAEENFHGYFWGKVADDSPLAASLKRYGVPSNWYNWGAYYDRFDVTKEPNESHRFGWMVEIDPTDPTSTPKKRTAMGRFKHEGAGLIVNKDGKVVAYMGDDERFDYLYRFVSAGAFDAANRAANMDLLDEGTLSVAKFNDDGSLEWLPLVHGQGPLTAENGFKDQAEVLIWARLAGDKLGATKMDRPEDVEVNPKTNKVYAMLTNNSRRKPDQVDAANPRPENLFGHIVELTPPDGDHTAARFAWDILVKCGDPKIAEVGASFNPNTSANGWFGMPDNCAVDAAGRLWVATDGNNLGDTGRADGVWAMETEGELRGTSRLFFRVPIGAEMCGPYFTPDDKTFFVAVQHPGAEDREGNPVTWNTPSTRWPDFDANLPPRPSIVVITKEDGGIIGA